MSGINERVALLSAKIDATIEELIASAESDEQVAALERYRTELHQGLAQRAFSEAMQGFGHQ